MRYNSSLMQQALYYVHKEVSRQTIPTYMLSDLTGRQSYDIYSMGDKGHFIV